MLHLHYSNRLEALAELLARDLADARAGDPFRRLEVVVPSSLVGDFAERALARRLGIVHNLERGFLVPRISAWVAQARPDAVQLDQTRMTVELAIALGDRALLATDTMAPLASYLAADLGDDRRLAQLAAALARTFQAYAGYRPELLAAWRRGERGRGELPPAAAAWQAALYRALCRGDAAEPQRWLERLGPELAVAGPVHLFGFGELAPGLAPALARLAARVDLRVYALNPTAGFWDDLGSREAAARAELPPLLGTWGQVARESIRVWNQLSEFAFAEAFVDPAAGGHASALELLQSDALHAHASERRAERAAVSLRACPSPRRELEEVGREIWRRLAADPTLTLADVAVFFPEAARVTYQAQVSAVFHELHAIPHHVVDLPLASESPTAEAVELLLDLPLGDAARPDLVRLLLHPALAIEPTIERDRWLAWIDALGIVHGIDHDDHRGSYIDRDLFNWDQGLRRLALGAFMTRDPGQAVSFGGNTYVPEELASGDLASAACLIERTRDLLDEARALARARLPLAAWIERLERWFGRTLVARDDLDQRHLDRHRAAIARLADLGGAHPLDYATVRELCRGQTAALRTTRGDVLADGVMVAPLAAGRILPFRLAFVVGLGAGEFPAADHPGTFDLRGAHWRASDVSLRDRDRHAVLELVLATREHLALSYVARDLASGERLQPSSVVFELADMLRRHGVDLETLEAKAPEHRFDVVDWTDPVGRRQAACAAFRRALEQGARGRDAVLPARPTLAARLAALDRPELDGILPPTLARPAVAPPRELRITALARFLECPLQAWARHVIGLAEQDDDRAALRDEPFARELAPTVGLLRDVLIGQLQAGGDLDGLIGRYRERATAAELEGRAPIGVFGQAQRRRDEEVLAGWWRGLGEGGTHARRIERLGLGRASRGADGAIVHPALVLEVAGRPVPLLGTTELGDADGALLFIRGEGAPPRYLVRGLVDRLVRAAAGLVTGPTAVTIIGGDGGCAHHAVTSPAPAEALAHLSRLASELVGQPHAYRLPCELVFAHLAHPERPLAAELDRLERGGGTASRFGPLAEVDELGPPADADELIARRWAPLLAGLVLP